MSEDTPAVEPMDLDAMFYGASQEQPSAIETPENTDKPEEEEAKPEAEAEDTTAKPEEEAKPEESEEAEEADSSGDDSSDDEQLYVEIGEREITVAQIKEWEKGSLRQSDYTKKSQQNAVKMREWESGKEEIINDAVSAKFNTLESAMTELESLISDADGSVDWEDLKQCDPDEFIKQTELKDKREAALSKAKAAKVKADEGKSLEFDQSEMKKLSSSHPEWFDDSGKKTDVYQSQIEQANDYFVKNEWTAEDQKSIRSAKLWNAVFDAAGKDAAKAKTKAKVKEIKKLPLTTKRKSKPASNKPKSDEALFYGS